MLCYEEQPPFSFLASTAGRPAGRPIAGAPPAAPPGRAKSKRSLRESQTLRPTFSSTFSSRLNLEPSCCSWQHLARLSDQMLEDKCHRVGERERVKRDNSLAKCSFCCSLADRPTKKQQHPISQHANRTLPKSSSQAHRFSWPTASSSARRIR